ncbi:hypothetical protein SAMN04489798_2299 [Pseudomonas arsenicoxydans]|uniref:Uncharacterized protein n=1 Tax=Pseudomonas arsenicoxydans TaxID=702115 RepID=A0A1H0HM02_9PSED|nr:hypothetical protein SAMN04489798_2299 [Pseudomonas arsenicoxydans]
MKNGSFSVFFYCFERLKGMADELMASFLSEQSDHSFANWRLWCVDHAERPGSFTEFVERLERACQALKRQKRLRGPFVLILPRR